MAPKTMMKVKAMKVAAAKPAKSAVAKAMKAKAAAPKRSAAAKTKRAPVAKKQAARSASKKRSNPKQEELWQVDESDEAAERELSPHLAAEVEPNLDAEDDDVEEVEEELVGDEAGDEPMAEDEEAVVTPARKPRKKVQADVEVPKTRKSKKVKKVVDPNKPKRPAGGAFGVFMQEHRAEITASAPEGSSVAVVSKLAGERWRAMDEEARKPYQEKYLVKAEAYTTAFEEYCVSIGVTPPKRVKVDEGAEGDAPVKARDLGPVPEADIDKAALLEVSGLGYETKFRTLIAMKQFRHLPHDKVVKALRCCGGRMSGNGRFPTATEILQKSL